MPEVLPLSCWYQWRASRRTVRRYFPNTNPRWPNGRWHSNKIGWRVARPFACSWKNCCSGGQSKTVRWSWLSTNNRPCPPTGNEHCCSPARLRWWRLERYIPRFHSARIYRNHIRCFPPILCRLWIGWYKSLFLLIWNPVRPVCYAITGKSVLGFSRCSGRYGIILP